MHEQGLYEGNANFELFNLDTGNVEAIIDLAWPSGIQNGLSEPVALLINETLLVNMAIGIIQVA